MLYTCLQKSACKSGRRRGAEVLQSFSKALSHGLCASAVMAAFVSSRNKDTCMKTDEFLPLMRDMYDVISGPAGQRDWERFRSAYHPQARLIRVNGRADRGQPAQTGSGDQRCVIMSVDEYIAGAGALFAKFDFREEEISHEAQVYGDVADVRSGFHAWLNRGAQPEEWSGVNCLQLVRAHDGWKVLQMIWDAEAGTGA